MAIYKPKIVTAAKGPGANPLGKGAPLTKNPLAGRKLGRKR